MSLSKKEDLVDFLRNNPGYLKWGNERVAKQFGYDESEVGLAKQILLRKYPLTPEDVFKTHGIEKYTFYDPTIANQGITGINNAEYQEFLKWKQSQVKEPVVEVNNRTKGLTPYKGNPDNVLVIGDIHCPFDLDDYLKFCYEQQVKFDCGTIVFIGDIIDNHYSSFHTSELDTIGPNREFDYALERVQQWYSVFPNATVILGNHDRIIHRQAKASGISDRWFKSLSDALKTPNWNFVESIVINGVNYNHGEGGTASTRMKNELQSQVQGHIHSEAYVEYSCGANHRVFGVQVGCGVNRKSYAFAYGKDGKKPMISCGVVLDKGQLPLIIPMNL